MRKRLAVLLVAAAFAPAAVASAAATHQLSKAAAVKTCGAGYALAHLSWGDKCLRAGEFCKVGNREYAPYGYVCPPTGRLRRR